MGIRAERRGRAAILGVPKRCASEANGERAGAWTQATPTGPVPPGCDRRERKPAAARSWCARVQ